MWIQIDTSKLAEGANYDVMQSDGFMQKAIYENGKFFNHITNKEIFNIARIWE